MMQPVAQLLEQPHLVEVHAHAAAVLLGLAVQGLEERLVLRFGRRHAVPGLDRVARVHRAPGVEAVRAELESEIDRGADLVRVEGRRRVVDLDGHAGCAQVLHALDRRIEIPAYPHAIEGVAGRAVEAHLHRLDADVLQARAVLRAEIVAVGLDLELAVAAADILRHVEEAPMDHRLAAREREVGHLQVHHLIEHREDLRVVELVGERFAGPLSSMQCRHARLHSFVTCQAM